MRALQLTLFERNKAKGARAGNGFRDPAFSDNKARPIHRWVPWIAGFSAEFVDDVIEAFGPRAPRPERPPVLLDPFCGVGTTLVQGMRKGWNTVGFEINPYAALASRIKVRAPSIPLPGLREASDSLVAESRRWREASYQPHNCPPTGFRSRIPFFSPPVEKQVLCLLDFIEGVGQDDVRDVLRVALGAVMVSFSNYSYEPSLGTRPAAGKPLVHRADVASVIVGKIREVAADIERLQAAPGSPPSKASHHVHIENFMAGAGAHLAACSVNLMITSPPYMNNYHYVRNTRPQLYWLSLVTDGCDTKRLEQDNFGKFWQTVRTGPLLEPTFVHERLCAQIRRLRRTRLEKGPYGGPGWANYVTAYFNDCRRFLKVLHRVLRRGGVGVVVIGNSIIQGIEFKVDRLLGDLAERQGFKVDVDQIRAKRVGASITQSSVRRGSRNGAALYESAVILRKK